MGSITAPKKIPILLLGASECVALYTKRGSVAVIKLRILRWEGIAGDPGEP